VEAASESARLLVVDDEATILELLSGSLRLAGFEVTTAASGAEPVRAAASGPDHKVSSVNCLVARQDIGPGPGARSERN
jgi:CheY-like chemotaxis protein